VEALLEKSNELPHPAPTELIFPVDIIGKQVISGSQFQILIFSFF
jgi:hypothetical protein